MKKIISVILSGFTVFSLLYGNFYTSSALDSLSETIEFYDGKAEVEINEEMFEQNSNGYHRNIALLASSLSSACYNGDKENGYYINRAYEKLGFDIENDVTLFSYEGAENNASYDTDLIDVYGDSLSFSVATREIGDTRLLVIALRGTNLNSTSDILNDISIFGTNFYKDSSPTGFVNFFRKVSVGLSLYLGEHPEITDSADKGNLKILITGHSLGGAGTNLLGAYFNTYEDNNYSGFDGNETVNTMFSEKLDIPQNDIFVYSFACPNVYYGDPTVTDCDNIINIINESDLIPQVPNGQKFGQFVYFDTNEDNGLSAHYGHKYVNATDKDIPDGVRYYGGAIDTVITEDIFYQDSTEYHSNIAEIAVALSSASYNGKRESGYYINSAYRQLGFTSDNIEIYGYPSDDYSFSFASQKIGQTTLLTVTLKGNSGKNDFYSQINKDFSQPFMNDMTNPDYYDFYIRVKNSLDEYISNHSEILNSAQDGKLKVLVSGHSIGGAGASLLGAELNSDDSILKLSQNDIFVYTFGCPNVYDTLSDNICPNIVNIINENDFVTFMPFGARDGKTVAFDNGTFGINCFEPKIYVENLSETTDNYITYRQITINNPYADFEVSESDKPIEKENLKILSDDEHTYIFIPSGDYKIKVSGITDEILELSDKNQKDFEKSYNNISLTDGKNIEYDIVKNNMYVTDKNGKPVFVVQTDGTETEYKEESDLKTETLVIAGTCALILSSSSAFLIFRKRKTTEKGD